MNKTVIKVKGTMILSMTAAALIHRYRIHIPRVMGAISLKNDESEHKRGSKFQICFQDILQDYSHDQLAVRNNQIVLREERAH